MGKRFTEKSHVNSHTITHMYVLYYLLCVCIFLFVCSFTFWCYVILESIFGLFNLKRTTLHLHESFCLPYILSTTFNNPFIIVIISDYFYLELILRSEKMTVFTELTGLWMKFVFLVIVATTITWSQSRKIPTL